jgi:hypothetical protein
LNGSDAIVGLLCVKAKRDWLTRSIDHIIGYHFKVALVLPVPAAGFRQRSRQQV